MAKEGEHSSKHFVHTHAAHFYNKFFFYPYGNTPPTDILQHVPHDSAHANVLSIGCGDLRDVLYSILLHGRRTVNGTSFPRSLAFMLNDWEPAIHAKNIILLHLFLDCRDLLDQSFTDGIAKKTAAVDIEGGSRRNDASTQPGSGRMLKTGETSSTAGTVDVDSTVRNKAFARRIGEIFSAMYNVFVDEGVLKLIQDSATKLAALAGSPSEWSSTGVGRYITFADDRTRDRVRAIFVLYSDESLQGRRQVKRVERERAASLNEHLGWPSNKVLPFSSRSMGLASFKFINYQEAYSKMWQQYFKDGVLDPFPLLRSNDETSSEIAEACKRVNPLLLVTERKGMAYCLHYGAFPLEAFHLDVTFWKLREERAQDEYGKLAPRVTNEQGAPVVDLNQFLPRRLNAEENRQTQNAWFGAALEELAQMCGAFLKLTSTKEVDLTIVVNAGDALNFCDALLAVSSSLKEERGGSARGNTCQNPAKLEPIAFQQGTLQPLKLLHDVFRHERAPAYDVIITSNLADHLGIINILVATAPLLREEAHSVILTNYMATVQCLDFCQGTADFYEKMLCMSSHTAAILLGVVAVPHISTVVDHADVNTTVTSVWKTIIARRMQQTVVGCSSTLRLTWKCPQRAFAGTSLLQGDPDARASVSPRDFVKLTLPVYKAMFFHILNKTWLEGNTDEASNKSIHRAMVFPKYYTGASFARLLALAGRRLRVRAEHFDAALHAVVDSSGSLLARNLHHEKAALFHTLDLLKISPSTFSVFPLPLDTRRIVLLVPQLGLSALRECAIPEVFLSVTGIQAPFDHHFATIHMTFVRVRRNGSTPDDDDDEWQALSKNLSVRDTRGDDPDAELMVSAVVPTFTLMLAPVSQTELQLRPRISLQTISAPKSTTPNLGRKERPVFYRATLENGDRTAILKPETKNHLNDTVPYSTEPLACPIEGLSNGGQALLTAPTNTKFSRVSQDGYEIDYSLELVSEGACYLYRVTMRMANEEARRLLKSQAFTPTVECRTDPCCLHVKLGKGMFVYATRFPFPVDRKALRLKFSKKQGLLYFTVPPLPSPIENPFSLIRQCIAEGEPSKARFSSWCFPASVPLTTLPRLDFNAEWAHDKVMGGLSFTPSEKLAMEENTITFCGSQPGLHGLKVMTQSRTPLHFVSWVHNGGGQVFASTYRDNWALQLSIGELAWTGVLGLRDAHGVPSHWEHSWLRLSETFDGGHGPTLWVWVNNILLDSSNEAIVLDCCIMLAERSSNVASCQLGILTDIFGFRGSPSVGFLEVQNSEFKVWRALLPGAVERARQSYTHDAECIYAKADGFCGTTICGCGRGKDLPPEFVTRLRSIAAILGVQTAVQTLFYRAVLSPLYFSGVPISTDPRFRTVVSPINVPKQCAKCGHMGARFRCSRCHNTTYCSKACQRNHWKVHKSVCSK